MSANRLLLVLILLVLVGHAGWGALPPLLLGVIVWVLWRFLS